MKNKDFGLTDEEVRVQLEQTLANAIVTQLRLEFIAYKTLSKEEYDKFTKNIADFVKKTCTNEKKVVNLQSKKDEENSSSL